MRMNPKTGLRIMRNPMCRAFAWLSAVLQFTSSLASANTSVHTSWLWHLHQPIYWPDRAPANHAYDHYQNAWDTLQLDQNGFTHPSDTSLQSVFDDADRLSAYQGEPNTVLQDLNSYANSGAQVNYSGALMENVQSLAVGDPSMGYSTSWNSGNEQARLWTTTNGKPRLDLTNFTYHHCIAPFVSDETLEMDILIDQRQEEIFWNSSSQVSRGYFPAETCFSERIIPTLQKLGIAWTVVANNHLTRSCADFPLILGSGGENCDIPNKADQINPAQGSGSYITRSISRGCSPTATAPFAFQLHYARYVDPNTGAASTMIVVPSDQALSWDDGYSTWDLGLISPIAAANNPAKPSFLLLAHDGDNAWGGGYSYYNQWVPQFAQTAVSDGYEPTTVEEFLSEFPPSTNDVVHVEDGGWVDADSDFGSPIYVNWHWPPSIPNSNPNVVDPSAGVSDKADVWRVISATENRVKTAQQMENTLTGYTNRIDQIRDPGSYGGVPAPVELGWHYYLAGLDSGFVYFGCTADECWRPVLAQSNAVRNVDSILAANPSLDTTPPTVFIPQRYPYNPGTTNFGVEYSYQQYIPTNTDFWVWTYAYDVSSITNVTLLYRSNGSGNPPTQDEFKTYAGGADTGPWIGLPMTDRSVAAQNTLLPPKYIADYYYTKVTGLTNTYVDYYVSATDSYGNTYNSPIQHVYVAAMPTGGSGGGGGGGSGGSTNGCVGRFCVSPTTPIAGEPVTITYNPVGGPIASATQFCLHLGWNNWATVISPDASMTFDSATSNWVYTTTVSSMATQMDCDANNCDGTWDNNSGADYKFAVSSVPPTLPPTPTNVTATAVSSSEIDLGWPATTNTVGYVVYRDTAQVGTTVLTTFDDVGLTANTLHCYTVASSNAAGLSAQSSSVCATTFTNSLPNPPTNVTATVVATNEINVTWSASAAATSYVVYRNGSPVTSTAGLSYSDVGLQMNAQYCYAIAATNSVGVSAQSAQACASTPAFQITGIAVQGGNVLVRWIAPQGSTNVVQATNGGTGGSYMTNFLPVSPPIIIPGSGLASMSTNYLDVGGATNSPGRYYRVAMGNATGLVSTQAFDNAAQSAYSGGWTNSSNGGFGFGPWTLDGSSASINSNGFFIGSSVSNAAGASPGIDTSNVSWGMYANGGNTSVAYRVFTSSVPVGGTLKIDMRNGYINSGGIDGFALRNGNASGNTANYNAGARFQYYFLGGTNDYMVVDSGGARSTGVGFTGTGQHLIFVLGTTDTYSLTIIDNASGNTNATLTGTLAGTSGSGINSISLFNINAGANTPYNLYFNSLSIDP
jgi:hypothetical protein